MGAEPSAAPGPQRGTGQETGPEHGPQHEPERGPVAESSHEPEPSQEPELPGGEPVGGRRVLCRMCGQPLRDRASRIWGLGPDCRHKLALRTAPPPPRDEVPQDPLPGM